jgi:WD40 repeat protein
MKKRDSVFILVLLLSAFHFISAQTPEGLKSKIKLDTSYNHGCDIYTLESAGDKLAFGDENGEIFFIDHGYKVLKSHVKHEGWINSLSCSPSKKLIASGGSDGKLVVYDIEGANEIKSISVSKVSISGVRFLTDSTLLMASDKLYLINVQTGKILKDFNPKKKITVITTDIPKKNLYMGYEDGSVIMIDIAKLRIVKQFQKHKSKITAITLSSDGKDLVSGDNNGLVYIWSLKSGKPVKSIKAHIDEVGGLLFSRDNTYLITAGWDKSIFVWNRNNYKLELNINAHKNIVTSILFWNDKLVTAGLDNTIKIWSNF